MTEETKEQEIPAVKVDVVFPQGLYEAPALLSKDAILAAEDLKTEVVEVPEWGGAVTVRSMTGVDRDAFESSINRIEKDANTGQDKQVRDLENFRARLCAATMVNAKGLLLFPNPEDVVKLGKKNSRALDRVMKVAQRLNGIGAEDVEQLIKN